MDTLSLTNRNLFGLLELDPAGMVLYSRIDRDNDQDATPDLNGSNFFTEVVSFLNGAEFRQRIENFTQRDIPAESFTFDCKFEDCMVPVRVLLARMRERSDGNRTKSVLVHIKKQR